MSRHPPRRAGRGSANRCTALEEASAGYIEADYASRMRRCRGDVVKASEREPYSRRIWTVPVVDDGVPERRQGQFVAPPTLVDSVVAELLRMMLSGELKPGERLVEERLTEHLGVSRPPLREALRVLQRDRVVNYAPRRGVVVAPLSPRDVREIYSLRWALERLAVDLAVPVENLGQLESLETEIVQMRSAAEAGDVAAVTAANWRFHLALCGLAGHSRLLSSYQSLTMQLQICMAMNLRFREELLGNALESVGRHEVLLEAIRSGDRRRVYEEIDHHGDISFMDQLDGLLSAP